LRVSDARTPFLDCLRSYLENYPNLDRHAPEWDVADSVLWMTVVFPQLSSQARVLDENSAIYARPKKANVWNALGRS
jgi:hypothetical protein